MAGHSKWANIKHRKARQDAKKGKMFTKLIRELTVAAKLGGDSPADNPRLRAAVDEALSANMTRDTIDRAIARGAGTQENENLEELVYEGYGPGGVAVLLETLTDNKNRTVAEVRHGFSKFGGNLGTSGSVSYLFSKKGYVILPDSADEDRVLELTLDAGVEDLSRQEDGSIELICAAEQLGRVKDLLKDAGIEMLDSAVTMIAATHVVLDQELAEKLLPLLDHLEDLDDVQKVYSNASIPDDVLERLQ
ncbi:MAG: YebC/PmpR family DNA-binding transcriptional regulator [Pseudomonadales bacterium]|nr:YebC/PmpR family DNA-binding transcriptional regulator [Pseudomonadales bacterium]